ncbi:protein-export chaperone SecB [Priestia aryabhattai]|jgi:preprotein translocase subunit SecB|uniref:protein-export chaperone SecB n=1 Tax=Priestia aryabhattai TaxID=412384 RepID=UPI0031018964
MSSFEEYKLIANSVQLSDVELISMKCLNKGFSNEKDEQTVSIKMQRKVEMKNNTEAILFLRTIVGGENSPFLFDIVYKGVCNSLADITVEQFEQYAYVQVVPLLLPYARECITSTMARMGLPIFTLPTMDILDSYEENDASDSQES